MSNGVSQAAQEESCDETAAHWHDRLMSAEVSDELRAVFANWLAASATHRVAYENVERTWTLAQLASKDPRMLALRHETALRLTRRSAAVIRRPLWAAAAVLVACVVGLVALGFWPQIAPQVAALGKPTDGHYATQIGERLVVNLKDGSQVTINTNSEVNVAFSRNERHVALTRGQALFEVAKDKARPFVVEANGRRFIAVGTAFDVRMDGGRVQVTMLEGTVRVERSSPDRVEPQLSTTSGNADPGSAPADPASRAIATISAGEQLSVDDLRLDRIRIADPERETSWRRGQLIFENTRLAEAIAEVNRYSQTRILLADSRLEDLRISGAFATGRPAVFVEALTSYFPIAVTRKEEQSLYLSKREATPAAK